MPRIICFLIYLFFGLTISLYDIKHHIIRNQALIKFSSVSVLVFFFVNRSMNFLVIAIAVIVSLLMALIFKGMIGSGDLKLLIALAFWCSDTHQWMQCLAIAWILGGLFSALLLLAKSASKQRIAFAPFIFAAFIAAI